MTYELAKQLQGAQQIKKQILEEFDKEFAWYYNDKGHEAGLEDGVSGTPQELKSFLSKSLDRLQQAMLDSLPLEQEIDKIASYKAHRSIGYNQALSDVKKVLGKEGE